MERLLNNNEDTVNLNDELIAFTTAAGSGTPTNVIIAPANTFIDANGNNLVNQGDLYVNLSSAAPNYKSSYIASVDSDTKITLVKNIGVSSGASSRVLAASDEPAVLYVGTAAAGATLKVRSAGGDDATFVNIQQGSFIPVQVKRVYNTGTTASNIVALF